MLLTEEVHSIPPMMCLLVANGDADAIGHPNPGQLAKT